MNEVREIIFLPTIHASNARGRVDDVGSTANSNDCASVIFMPTGNLFVYFGEGKKKIEEER